MNEPEREEWSKEDLISWLDGWREFCKENCDLEKCFGDEEECEQAYQQIRTMIENQPEVDEAFVEERVNEMEQMFMQPSKREDREYFIRKRTLTEAGVRMKK